MTVESGVRTALETELLRLIHDLRAVLISESFLNTVRLIDKRLAKIDAILKDQS